jgi:hypothetical protein
MEDKSLKVWEVDINKSYWLDDDLNIWKSEEDFYDYHIEEYTGIKDNIEYWQEEIHDEHNLMEYDGSEIIKIIFDDMQESLDYYRNKLKEMEK